MSGSRASRPSGPAVKAEEVARTNRNVNLDQIKEAEAVLGELRNQGLARRGYGLSSPYETPRRIRRQS
jgi:hypothetical protein